ncbi:DEAD/DEAH box helicase family protein [Candidatus Berkiella cookevillensis]|uniref:DEAD/DEAH box helicase family protein n=1 Tax=Candidatus Berkiella cookevillensis TaxID=437022 RepID=A0A0Q9YBV9_9GAMM|nr:Z1 domain-containing protein [Candidatus Berkiella cookevillensis]MCS5707338.1 DEAD/DEAH box helicase family protein [Candidatus Berkiella cookevillensis]
MFDVSILKKPKKHTRYSRQIQRIKIKSKHTQNIESAVEATVKNIQEKCRSFVIYGEPQSGKTEMMIALTSRLLDEGFKIIIILLNDSIQLLNQNLDRFKRSDIDPAPKNFNEILDPAVLIGSNEWVIFSKKNSRDLQKLLDKIGRHNRKIIIDDEADYATPNAKVNSGEKTKINSLVEQLINSDGIYIGVTATPARLDLNNTFRNENEKWVDFPAHPLYKGQNAFFPISITSNIEFKLKILPDSDDNPKYLREALFGFLINVAHLNISRSEEKNYSILIHTSGKRADHSNDYKEIVKTFNILNNESDDKFELFYKKIWKISKDNYPNEEDRIIEYIHENINRNTIVVMNSDSDKSVVDYTTATNPSALFTVAIGGNIVSRGVTFDNLLSMFFTRDVKHKIQQDTYVQRARMFGSRGDYLPFFELHIPEKLYMDWHRCFVFHRLSLESIRAGNGSPVWLEDKRIAAVSANSIDKTTVCFDQGEMSFELFKYTDKIDDIINNEEDNLEKLMQLHRLLGKRTVPNFLLDYIKNFSPNGNKSIAVHNSKSIAGYVDADQKRIERARGFIGNRDLEQEKYPCAIHHITILYNDQKSARLFYKYKGNIKFIRNIGSKLND